jgi:hypothetical protein
MRSIAAGTAKDWGYSWKHAIPEMLSRVLFIALISVCAFAIGAAQMLPALDHVSESARSRTFDFSLVSAWSMPWAKFAEFIYPNFLGYISIDRVMWYWGGGLYPGMGSPFCSTSTVACCHRPRDRRVLREAARREIRADPHHLLAADGLGGNAPVLKLYEAGIATGIRYPEKFLLVAIFATIIFAAQLFDRLLNSDDKGADAIATRPSASSPRPPSSPPCSRSPRSLRSTKLCS